MPNLTHEQVPESTQFIALPMPLDDPGTAKQIVGAIARNAGLSVQGCTSDRQVGVEIVTDDKTTAAAVAVSGLHRSALQIREVKTIFERQFRGEALTPEERQLANTYVPGAMDAPTDTESVRRAAERRHAFLGLASSLEDSYAQYAQMPGQHAPALIPAIGRWHEQYRQQVANRPMEAVLLGAYSRDSGVQAVQIYGTVDPGVNLTVVDIDPLTHPEQEPGAFTSERGNALNLQDHFTTGTTGKGPFKKNQIKQVDSVMSHMLFGAQTQIEPMTYSAESGLKTHFANQPKDAEESQAKILSGVFSILREGGAAFMVERIDLDDPKAVDAMKRQLVKAGFKSEKIQFLPALMYATRRSTDAYLMSTSSEVISLGQRAEVETTVPGKGTVKVTGDVTPQGVLIAQPGRALIVAEK